MGSPYSAGGNWPGRSSCLLRPVISSLVQYRPALLCVIKPRDDELGELRIVNIRSYHCEKIVPVPGKDEPFKLLLRKFCKTTGRSNIIQQEVRHGTHCIHQVIERLTTVIGLAIKSIL